MPAPRRQIGNAVVTADVDGLAVVAGIAKAGFSFGLTTAESALTIVRTRGQMLVTIVDNSGVRQIMQGAMGIILVSSDAFSAGIGSLPGPISDDQNDWYVWAPFTLSTLDGTADDQAISQTVRVDFDSRGMRKSKFGDVAAIVLEIESDVAAGGIDASLIAREQFKL